MRAIRSKDTKSELLIRSFLHRVGYRFRTHFKDLPGKPDIVFTKRKKIIFIHGCFWHQHSSKNCRDSKLPSTNIEYWHPKLERTVKRDKEHLKALKKLGWEILIIWECETLDLSFLGKRLIRYLGPTSFKGPIKK